ncbi:MAG: hypothetical protein HZA46_14690 [Planctomycetales bacterium]|nr:hypothetical protein [Planctomycetales bacterium]
MPKANDGKNSARSNVPEHLSEPTDGPDILDWDACIEVAPIRPTGKVKVRLHYQGRDKPLPLENPQDEKAQRAS